jgi:hypothetical protein
LRGGKRVFIPSNIALKDAGGVRSIVKSFGAHSGHQKAGRTKKTWERIALDIFLEHTTCRTLLTAEALSAPWRSSRLARDLVMADAAHGWRSGRGGGLIDPLSAIPK